MPDCGFDKGNFLIGSGATYIKSGLETSDPEKKERWTPYVIEPSVSPTRIFLSVLLDAWRGVCTVVVPVACVVT